jgi:hypothetical protein
MSPPGEELQREERVGGPAFPQVHLDRVVLPVAGRLLDRHVVDAEPADHAAVGHRGRDLSGPGLGDVGPVVVDRRERAAEEHLPGRAAEHLVVGEMTWGSPIAFTRHCTDGLALTSPSTKASTTPCISLYFAANDSQVSLGASNRSVGSRSFEQVARELGLRLVASTGRSRTARCLRPRSPR